jgi:hypothetical protein
MSDFETISSVDLSSIVGGLDASGELKTPAGSIKGQFKTGPSTPGAPEPDKQLRCYSQVASQAGWMQGSRETLRQQKELCGPLRP